MEGTPPQEIQIDSNKSKILSKNVIIFYFIMLGGASNFAWNATSNSFDYFATKFPDYSVTFVFPIAIYVAQMLSIFVIARLSSLFSYHVRILFCLVVNATVVFLISLQAQLFQETLFGMFSTMLLLFILGFASNLSYASAAGFVSHVEPKYTAYVLIGVSLFGVLASSLKAIVLWAFESSSDDELAPTFIYYCIVTLVFVFTLTLHLRFMRSEFYRSKRLIANDTSAEENNDTQLIDDTSQSMQRPKRDLSTLLVVFKDVKFYLFLLFVLYIQMDLPFPGVMLKKPMPGIAHHTKTVSLMLTFTVFLVTGKKLGQYREYYSPKVIVGIILARFALVAFFIIQAVAVTAPVFSSIWFGYLNVALFGLTMGFSSVALFIIGAEQVLGEKKEVSGFLSVFTVNIGAIVGGFSSLLLENISSASSTTS